MSQMIVIPNTPAPNAPYFTPVQSVPAGTGVAGRGGLPKLFQPLKLKQYVLPNRILLSPLCQYSAEDGHQTDWHFAHLGGIISRGPGLSFVEATSVVPEGRITPEDCGLWKDSQIPPLKRIVDFAHSQGQLIGIQLGHAGRKASTCAPFLTAGRGPAKKVKSVNGYENEGFMPEHGWPDQVMGPSPLPYKDNNIVPREMSKEDISNLITAWSEASQRAVKAGFDAIEIHAAHGYLLHEFLSPTSNKRTDNYGGSFENRIRLLVEIVRATKAAIPSNVIVFVRVSGTDWLEHLADVPSWDVQQTVELAKVLAKEGIDVLDVSSGGNDPRHKIETGPSYQAPFAKAVKEAVGDDLVVATVGSIVSGGQANALLEQGLDLVLVGRSFQKNPGLVSNFAEDVGVEAVLPSQIRWGFGGRTK